MEQTHQIRSDDMNVVLTQAPDGGLVMALQQDGRSRPMVMWITADQRAGLLAWLGQVS
jgi:hypothetical protein